MREEINLSSIHFQVYDLFKEKNIAGPNNAVNINVLAAVFSVNRRKMQRIIEEINLSSHFHKPILGNSKGVFMATSVHDGFQNLNNLKRKTKAMINRIKAVENKLIDNGQLALVLSDKPYSKSVITSILEGK